VRTLLQRRNFLLSLIPLFCIATNEVFKLYFLLKLRDWHGGDVNLLESIWLGLQILFSIVFGLVSDKFCRKKTLLVTLIASTLAAFFVSKNLFWLAIFIDGIFGNVLPIARAAYYDISEKENKISLLTNTFIIQAIPWILLCANFFVFTNLLVYVVITTASLSILLTSFFKDVRDKKKLLESTSNEIRKITHKFYKIQYLKIGVAFFIAELTYQIFPYFSESHFSDKNLQLTFFLLGIGVAGGCLMHKFFRFSDSQKGLSFVFFTTLLVFLLSWISSSLSGRNINSPIPLDLYLKFAFLGGMYLPLIYAFFVKKAKTHQIGMLFGILEALQSLAEFSAPFLMVTVFSAFKNLNFLLFLFLIFSSFILVLKKDFFAIGKTYEK
jgi:MFS family permease